MAVVDKQSGARLERLEDFRMEERNPPFIARCVVHIEAEIRTGLQHRPFVVGKGADAEFGSLQVHADSDGPAHLFLDLTDIGDTSGVVFVTAVAEVEAEHISTGVPQFSDGLNVA